MAARKTLQEDVLDALGDDYRLRHRESLLCRYLFERYLKRFGIAAKLALAEGGIEELVDCILDALLGDPAFRKLGTLDRLAPLLNACDEETARLARRRRAGSAGAGHEATCYAGATALALRRRIRELLDDPLYPRIRAELARHETTVRSLAAEMLERQADKRPNSCLKAIEWYLDEMLSPQALEPEGSIARTARIAREALDGVAASAFADLASAARRDARQKGASPFDNDAFRRHVGALLDKKGYEWLSNAGAVGGRSTVANVRNLDIDLVERCLAEPGFLERWQPDRSRERDASPEEMCRLLRSIGASSLEERGDRGLGWGRETIVPLTADSTFSSGLFAIADGWFGPALKNFDAADRAFLERHGAIFAAIFLADIDIAGEGYRGADGPRLPGAHALALDNGYTCITFAGRLAGTLEGARDALAGYRQMRCGNEGNALEFASWNLEKPAGMPASFERYFIDEWSEA